MTATVLVTGFEPFGGRSVNASWEAVVAASDLWVGPERLVTARLPVDFRAAPARLEELLAAVAPDVVVCVGEAGGRRVVSLERVALNLVDAPVPDNAGVAPVDEPVVPGGPTAYLASLPVKACARAVRAAGVPAEVSHTAGTFVCNATSYVLLHRLARASAGDQTPPARGGFVHVPTVLPGSTGDDDATRLGAALVAVVRTALDVAVDAAVSAGTVQ